jgi:DNA-binding XRE family transcriptional regulator
MKPQFIKTESGEELVVLPRRVYDALTRSGTSDEDTATAMIVDRGKAAIAAGYDLAIPAATAEAIAQGVNPIRAAREWRGLTQAQLAKMTGLTQSYISQLEAGDSAGTPKALRAVANVLQVPLDLLVAD